MDTGAKLIDLAKAKFDELTKAETKLFEETPIGIFIVCSGPEGKDNDPNNADQWPAIRTIRAECVEWLCTDPEASSLVTHKGVQVKGARIDGEIDLKFAKISFPLYFEKCAFPQPINLQNAEIRALNLQGTHTGQIKADRLKVDGSVFLRNGFKAEGEVRLIGATIGGQFNCSASQFINPDGIALNADSLKVDATAFFCEGFEVQGEVHFFGATIGDYFVWTDVDSPENVTLDLRSSKIGTLWDDERSWPKPGKLRLDGLVYERLFEESPQVADARKRWLHLQPKDRFLPQPYEQLANVLRKMGKDADAKKILIAKNEDRAKWGPKLSMSEKLNYGITSSAR